MGEYSEISDAVGIDRSDADDPQSLQDTIPAPEQKNKACSQVYSKRWLDGGDHTFLLRFRCQTAGEELSDRDPCV
ncbi:hypothetical protein QO006_002642 [Deinococcus enclensis]|uniref:Uncharacterized protein n=1 Tax=Deinococcus enclensis TaxID=1049582 RepID=A0ABT9MG76_9DEIO|nr:hypothetical protein [Deinococcus enclensis]